MSTPISLLLSSSVLQIISCYLFFIYTRSGINSISPIWIIIGTELLVALRFRRSLISATTSLKSILSSKPQLHLLSIGALYVINMLLTFFIYQNVNASTIALFQISATLLISLFTSSFLHYPISPVEWTSLIINLTSTLSIEWEACLQIPKHNFWIYLLVAFNVLLSQFCKLWTFSILKLKENQIETSYTTRSIIVVILAMITATFYSPHLVDISAYTAIQSNIPSSVWNFIGIPWIQVVSLVLVEATLSLLWMQHSKSSAQLSSPHHLTVLSISTFIKFGIDYFFFGTLLNISVGAGLLASTLSLYLFTSSNHSSDSQLVFITGNRSNSTKIEPPTQNRLPKKASPLSLSDVIPEFMLKKCRQIHWVILGLSIMIAFVIFGSFLSFSDSEKPLEPVETSPIPQNQFPIPFIDFTFQWNTTERDYQNQIEMVEPLIWKKRNPKGPILHNKPVAVCLAGNVEPEWSRDLEWLTALHRSLEAYDLFVWLHYRSIPYGTRKLKQLDTRWTSSPPPSKEYIIKWKDIPMAPKYRWMQHLWGLGECFDMLSKHQIRTNVTYEYLMIAQPDLAAPWIEFPYYKTWGTDIHFAPRYGQSYVEEAFYGPVAKMELLVSNLWKNLAKWSGPLVPQDYIRNMAKHLNISVLEHERNKT